MGGTDSCREGWKEGGEVCAMGAFLFPLCKASPLPKQELPPVSLCLGGTRAVPVRMVQGHCCTGAGTVLGEGGYCQKWGRGVLGCWETISF